MRPPARRGPPGSPRACRRRAGSGRRSAPPPPRRRAPVEQPPHALVAVQVGERRRRRCARTRSGGRARRRSGRRPAARRRGRRAAPRPSPRVTPGLVAEHQHQHIAARVDDAERRGDRGRATLAVGLVDDHLGAGQVDRRADLVGGAADRDDRLVEPARAGDADDVAEQRAVAVGEQLLGAPEALRAAGAEHEPGDEGLSRRRRHARSRPRTSPCSPRSRSRTSRRRARPRACSRTAATVIPQIGSTAIARRRGGRAAGTAAAAARRTSTTLARIESAISAAVREPISMPGGHVDALEQLLGDAVGAQLVEHAGAALARWRRGRRRARPTRGRGAARAARRARAPRRPARGRRLRLGPVAVDGDHLEPELGADPPHARPRSASRRRPGRAARAARARGRPRSRRPTGRGCAPSRRRPRPRPPPSGAASPSPSGRIRSSTGSPLSSAINE